MQFGQLKTHDAILACVIGLVVIAAGASHRSALARRFAAAREVPLLEPVKRDATPPPAPWVRVLTGLPDGAAVFDRAELGARPVAQIRPGAVIEVTTSGDPRQARLQGGAEVWVTAARLASESASSEAIALFDANAHAMGTPIRASRGGPLYANTKLTERLGGFTRGEKVEILRSAGNVLLVAASDGAAGKVIGYARTIDVRVPTAPPAAVVRPASARGPSASPLAGAAAPPEPPAPEAENGALQEARDQYASGNFKEALARAEEAAAKGSLDALVLAAMSACKLGDIDKALRHVHGVRGERLTRFRAACPQAQPSQLPAPAADDAQQSTTTPPPPAADLPEAR